MFHKIHWNLQVLQTISGQIIKLLLYHIALDICFLTTEKWLVSIVCDENIFCRAYCNQLIKPGAVYDYH